MKSVIASVAVSFLAGLASAAVAFTNSDFSISAGSPFTLKWSGGVGPYTINLKDGPSGNLQTVKTLTSTSSESFTFTPDSSLTTGTYAFEIIDAAAPSQPNYSQQWAFSGSAASSSAAASSTVKTTTVVSSSASASATTASSSAASTTVSRNSTTSASSTGANTTSSSSPSRTSAATSSTSTAPSTNNAFGLAAPFLTPMLLAAGVAAAAL